MADLPNRQELFRRWRAAALAVPGTRISPREIDRDGSDLNLNAAAASIMGEEIVNRLARAVAGNFEDTASGQQLDRVIFDRKGIPRKPAAPSVLRFALSRPTSTAGAGTVQGGELGDVPAPTRVRTNAGIVYFLKQNAAFGATDLGPILVDGQAVVAGLANEIDEDQDWSFVDAPFDETIAIANAVESAGAADEELDSAFKARVKDFFRTTQKGTIGAIEFGLRNTPGIESASVVEILSTAGLPACSGQAFILDALGQANETLGARGLLSLLEFRPIGIPISVIPGTPLFINVDFSGTSFDTAIVLDTSQAEDDVKSAVVAALNNQQPGQKLLRMTILAAAKRVAGFVFEPENLVEPAGTLIPASPDIVFRTRRELVRLLD